MNRDGIAEDHFSRFRDNTYASKIGLETERITLF